MFIFKQFDVRGSDSIWGGAVRDVAIINGEFCAFNGKLYIAVSSKYSETRIKRLSVFENDKLLFVIQDAGPSCIDIIDGDIYILTIKERRWGGDSFYSLYLYRGEKEECVLNPESDVYYAPNAIIVSPGS